MLPIGKRVNGPRNMESLPVSLELDELLINGANSSDDGMTKWDGKSEDSISVDGEPSDERGEDSDGVKKGGRMVGTSLKCLKGSTVLTRTSLPVTGLGLGNRSARVAVDSGMYVSSGPEPEQGDVYTHANPSD